MTLLEMLRQMFGGRLDEEVDTTESDKKDKEDNTTAGADGKKETTDKRDSETVVKVSEKVEDKAVASENNNDANNNGGVSMELFEEGWLNSETGEIDEKKIKNQEMLDAIRTLTGRYREEQDKRMISDSLNDELKNYYLNVSNETFRKLIDLNSVTVKDGKVLGVKEAIEALKKSEPSVFKDKEKESNPLNEGFNPTEKTVGGMPHSFAEAFKLMEEIN